MNKVYTQIFTQNNQLKGTWLTKMLGKVKYGSDDDEI